jgi:hypothetical protein
LAYFKFLETAHKNPIKPIKTHPKNPWVGGFLKKPTHSTNPASDGNQNQKYLILLPKIMLDFFFYISPCGSPGSNSLNQNFYLDGD